MDPVTISLIIGGVISLIDMATKAVTALQGVSLTPEQRAQLHERSLKLTEAIEAETQVPAPPE